MTIQIPNLTLLGAVPAPDDYLPIRDTSAGIDKRIVPAVLLAFRQFAVNVLNHGAIGDGTTDDTLALRAAVTAAGANGTVLFPPGYTFLLSGSINPLAGQTWIGYGCALKRRNSLSTTTATAIGTVASSNALTVASASGFAVGMDVTIYNGASYDTVNHRITAIAGNLITIDNTFIVAFPSGGTLITSFPLIDCNRFGAADYFALYGLELNGNKANNAAIQRWEIHQEAYIGGAGVRITDCYIHDAQSEGILVFGTDVQVRGCYIIDCSGNGIHLGATSNQIQVCNNWIKNTNLGGSGNGHVSGCVAISSSIFYSYITNNYMENGYAGVGAFQDSTNIYANIVNNMMLNCTNYAVHVDVANTNYVEDIIIVGNLVKNCGTLRINQSGTPSGTLGPRKMTIASNTFEDTIFNLTGVNNLSVVGNTIANSGTTLDIFAITDATGLVIDDNMIVGGKGGVVLGAGASRGVSIKNNTFRNQHLRSIYFWADALGAIDISGNTILLDTASSPSSSWRGINMDGNGATVQGNHIHTEKNTSGHYAILCPPGGASVQGAVVSNNTIRSGSNVPSIRTPAGSQKNIIVNNFIQQAVSDGGSPNNTITNNTTIL